MPRWYRHALVVWLGLAMPLAFAACAGKSSSESGEEGGHSGSSGTAGMPSSGGSKAGGTGGISGSTGGASGASPGEAGAGGASVSCTYAPIGSFCVVGNASGDGQNLVEGMPLTVSMRPAGCYSSSCTQLVSTDCNYIGSNGIYWVSGFICLASAGNACTDDCGGGGNPVCQPGVTLTAGDYTIGIGGTSLAVKFSVPSHVASSALCASAGEP